MRARKSCYPMLLLLLFTLVLDSTTVDAAKGKSSDSSEKYTLNVSSANILLNEDLTLSVDGVTDEDVSFNSDDSSVSVDSSDTASSCKCTGTTVGKATVTVKIKEKGFLFFPKNTTTLTCKITVTPKANSINFIKKTLKLAAGTKKKLTVTVRPSISTEIPEYKSSNTKIVSVNANGTVTAQEAGSATITATIQNKSTAICKITVTKAKNETKIDDSDNENK